MRTTVEMTGFPELVVQKAINMGLAKTKNEAIRLGMLSLNKEFSLIKENNTEDNLVIKKLVQQDQLVKSNKIKLLNKKDFYKKYN